MQLFPNISTELKSACNSALFIPNVKSENDRIFFKSKNENSQEIAYSRENFFKQTFLKILQGSFLLLNPIKLLKSLNPSVGSRGAPC